MMKEIQRKKKVLIDLTNYGSLTAGFGQIAANYATAFSSMPVDDLHFVYLLRQKYMQEFGPNVTSVPVRRINKFFPFTLPKVDVWHAVNQQRKMLRIAGGTKFIFTIHDFNFLTEKKPWKAKMYLRRMQNKVNKAAVVTTISHYVADVIRQHVDLKGKEIRVIYNGVERIDTLEGTKPSFATGRPFFFTIGQIRRKKNFHLLVDVMRHFPEYDLYICGDAHFAYAEEVRNLIRENQLTNVFLTDVISQSEKSGYTGTVRHSCFLVREKALDCRWWKLCNLGRLYLPLIALVYRKFVMDTLSCGSIWIQNLWCKVSGSIYLIFIKTRSAWKKSRNMPLHSVTRSIYKPTLICIGS